MIFLAIDHLILSSISVSIFLFKNSFMNSVTHSMNWLRGFKVFIYCVTIILMVFLRVASKVVVDSRIML